MLLTIGQLIDFSPGEKYLANCSSHEPSNPRDTHVRTPFFYPFFRDYYNIYSLTTVRFASDQRVVLNIFDVRTGKIMKGFNERADEFAFGETGGFTGVSWPVFR
ncbi:putative eukaryotic translation initiation factor 3 subunit B [Helianthus annuus]|nr:putative eukaryotic translation initiation factor 3 subunit B [Helianthus annuus]